MMCCVANVIIVPYILGDLRRWKWASHTTIFTRIQYFSHRQYKVSHRTKSMGPAR